MDLSQLQFLLNQALLTRSIFRDNVSTIGRPKCAKSSIFFPPSLNDLDHLWTFLSEGASSPANEFKSRSKEPQNLKIGELECQIEF